MAAGSEGARWRRRGPKPADAFRGSPLQPASERGDVYSPMPGPWSISGSAGTPLVPHLVEEVARERFEEGEARTVHLGPPVAEAARGGEAESLVVFAMRRRLEDAIRLSVVGEHRWVVGELDERTERAQDGLRISQRGPRSGSLDTEVRAADRRADPSERTVASRSPLRRRSRPRSPRRGTTVPRPDRHGSDG